MQKPNNRFPNKQPHGAKPAQRPGTSRDNKLTHSQPCGPRTPLCLSPHIQKATPGNGKNAIARNVIPRRPEIRATTPRQTPPTTITNRPHGPRTPPPSSSRVGHQSGIQRTASRVIQGIKLYPNLHPGAVEPVNPSNIFRLNSFADQYRLHRVGTHGVNVPNQQYNFVRTREGDMLLHNRYRHPSIAEGKQVLYAGEIYFNNGNLQWWSNGSGHYQPGADDAEQARLPMDRFFSYQQIIKGEHTRKKG